jgi:hypothetical protein
VLNIADQASLPQMLHDARHNHGQSGEVEQAVGSLSPGRFLRRQGLRHARSPPAPKITSEVGESLISGVT